MTLGLLGLSLAGGCQTPTATYFRDEVAPQDPATRVMAVPLLLPAYLVLTVLDIVIINPVHGAANVPQVTGEIWSWGDAQGPWVAYGAMMPLKLIGIPLSAIGTTVFSEQFEYESSGDGQRPAPLRPAEGSR
jgi:hypothetical protein